MDRYHIYEAIGRGKHSVYKGEAQEDDPVLRLKSVDKSQRPRVLQEVQVLRSVSHPLVLKFHAWYETKNHLWLILEYCVGGDLLGLLKQDERLPERSVAVFARDLVAALRASPRRDAPLRPQAEQRADGRGRSTETVRFWTGAEGG